MPILCDTCTVLMLIRIAPDMFIDTKYECLTINEVHGEIFQTTKFKYKYPWRADYKLKIVSNTSVLKKDENFNIVLDVIKNKISAGTINRLTGRYFDLSYVDRLVAAYAVNYDLSISTSDNDLINFLKQEFEIRNMCSLEIINTWLKAEILIWNDEHHKLIREWIVDEEPEQPRNAKKEFERITGYRFI